MQVEVLEEGRARARAVPGDDAGQALELRVADGLEHERRDDLALAAYDAVDGAGRVVEELGRDEGRAVAADEYEGAPGRVLVSLARSTTSGTLAR